MSCRPFFTFSIDGHNFTVIEADGTEHDPVEVQKADIYAGQLHSIYLQGVTLTFILQRNGCPWF